MLSEKVFAVVGGDTRQTCLANLLSRRESGHKIYAMYLDREPSLSSRVHSSGDVRLVLPQSDMVFFPIPMLEGREINTPLGEGTLTWESCLDYLSPDAFVMAGRVPLWVREQAKARGIVIHDYTEREDFAIQNAVPTAEGAIEIALRELQVTLSDSACMVIGYGRISKVLTRLLRAFGATVYVAARSCSALTWAEMDGAVPVHLSRLEEYLGRADVLFNTVPVTLLGEPELLKLKRYCLIIDLASKPGGVDFAAAEQLGLKTIWALSLPGRVAPVSAAEIMLRTAYNTLGERGFQP